MLTGQRLSLTARVSRTRPHPRDSAAEFRRLMSSKPDLADTIFSRVRRPPRDPALRRGRSARPHHRFAVLGRRDGAAGVRRTVAPSAHVDRYRGRRRCRRAARDMGFRPSHTPVVVTTHRSAAAPDPRRARRAPRAHVPARARVPVRPRRRRQRTGRARRRGLRRVRRARHALARRRRHGRPGGRELAHRELRRLPERHLGRGAHVTRRDPGATARSSAQRAVRGRRPARRSRTSTSSSSPTAARSRAGPIVIASGARYQRLAVDDLERFEGAGVYYAATDLEARAVQRPRRDRGRRRQLRGPGRDLPRAAGQSRLDRDPRHRPRRAACRVPHRADRGRSRASPCSSPPRCGTLSGDRHLEHRHPRAHAVGRTAHRRVCRAVLLHRRRPRDGMAGRRARLDAKGFILTDRSLPERSPRLFAARDHCPSRRRCPGSSRSATSGAARCKRVAAAVGEGSSAVRSVHEYLATTATRSCRGVASSAVCASGAFDRRCRAATRRSRAPPGR